MDDTNLEDLTKPELQERLKKLGKKTTGNKVDLIERLYDISCGNPFVDDEAKDGEEEEDDDEDEEYEQKDDTPPLTQRDSEQLVDSDEESVSYNSCIPQLIPLQCLIFRPLFP